MCAMIPFRYSGLLDVPRYILLKFRDTWLFLCCAFDEALDDYPESYAVYRLRPSVELLLRENWGFVYEMMVIVSGRSKLQDVRFDDTKRATLDPSCFDVLDQLRES